MITRCTCELQSSERSCLALGAHYYSPLISHGDQPFSGTLARFPRRQWVHNQALTLHDRSNRLLSFHRLQKCSTRPLLGGDGQATCAHRKIYRSPNDTADPQVRKARKELSPGRGAFVLLAKILRVLHRTHGVHAMHPLPGTTIYFSFPQHAFILFASGLIRGAHGWYTPCILNETPVMCNASSTFALVSRQGKPKTS